MSTDIDVSETLDVTGENCPIPVVKTKQSVDDIDPGETLEVVATDPGSMNDISGWAETADGVELVDQLEADASGETHYKHYVTRTE
jgi:TusA-related sulfurtransferase